MTLTSGTRLGAYEVLGSIGAGGMGEVYRARDTRLNREVAIKILPEAFAGDADRLTRFEREAHALAALNHPNIAQIYGIEGDPRAIVMELVKGEDLSEIIARRTSEARPPHGMTPDEALPIARQIALALEVAHEAGIVHRDLKPANIKLTDGGIVKVLDFGLAKAVQKDGSRPELSPSNSPTLTGRATELGVILGTAAYMAPEQARGRAVDRRADVWAFGVVLYEMLTGRRAFSGEDVTEVMAAVIRDTPDLDALPAGTPAAVRRLLGRCLEKDPRKRLRDMGDAGLELDEAMSGVGADASGARAGAAGSATSRWSAVMIAAGTMAIAAIAALAAWMLKPAPVIDRPLGRFAVMLEDGQQLSSYSLPSVALSRDGRRLAYRTPDGIFVRNLDEIEGRRLTRSPGSGIWFSPDGDALLFATPSGLSKMPASGGPVQELVAAPQLAGVDWADDGTIVFSTESSIVRIPETGGAPTVLVETAPAGELVGWPQLLPGGRLLLYSRAKMSGGVATVVRSLDTGTEQVVLDGVGGARYLDTGHLVYGGDGRLLVASFDVANPSGVGRPVQAPESVYVSTQTLWVQAAFSRNGTLAYVSSGESASQTQLVWADGQGKLAPALAVPRVYSDPRLSPDGRRAALHLWDEENDIWIADLVRGGFTRLTFTPSEEETAVWSPDGREVAYAATRVGEPRLLFRRAADGSAAAVERKVWHYPEHFHVNDWSPDGRTILVEVRRPVTVNDILAIDVASGKETVLLASNFSERQARLSHDGKWLAYTTDESGRDEVYVQPYPALDGRVPVSTAGGVEPVWSRDGKRLYFRSLDAVMAADVTRSTPLEFAAPRQLFPDRFIRTQGDTHTHYDVDAGGRLLLIENPRDATQPTRLPIHIVLNWAESLRKLTPVK